MEDPSGVEEGACAGELAKLRAMGAAAGLHQAAAEVIFDRCLGYLEEHPNRGA